MNDPVRNSATVFSLGGEWKIDSGDNRYHTHVTVPGTVFLALERDGEFGPYGLNWREENRKAMDIARRVFTFSREFTVEAALLQGSGRRIQLECDGLDTLATITLNGKPLGTTDNMHRVWSFDVTRQLCPGTNRISITFADAVGYVEAAQKRRTLKGGIGFAHLRKSHCSYGWDWGPSVPDVGIWRPIRLVAYDGARVDEIQVRQRHSQPLGKKATVAVTTTVKSWAKVPRRVRVTLTAPDGMPAGVVEVKPGVEAELPVARPQLWWPRGLGEQPLYTVTIELCEGDRVLETHVRRIGFRTMVMDRSKLKIGGERFAFVVNGVPFFSMGADYIPEDTMLTRMTPARTRGLLEDCVRANFNTVRVWGGAVWPSDNFYEDCDELGLVIWQDCMFACASYDMKNKAFVATFKEEIRENLRRIRHHASIGLVCGNNEIEWHLPKGDKQVEQEYLLQFEKIIAGLVEKEVPDAFYWPSSPSSGGGFDNPTDFTRGDQHDWSVWHGNKPFTSYRANLHRFASEFGVESFPSPKTVASFTEPVDHDIFSPVMDDHQRSGNGNGRIFGYLAQHYRFPRDFDSVMMLSQFSQAEAIRYGVEHWRRNRPVCMGAIYWQLNDNWPVASWASIDCFGRWKALQYAARRFFNPVLLSCEEDNEKRTAVLHLTNERREALAGMVDWKLYNLQGGVVREGSEKCSLRPMTTRKVVSLEFVTELAGIANREHVLWYQFTGTDERWNQSATTSFTPFKWLSLPDPKLSVKVGRSDGRVWIEVTARAFAKFVWLDLKAGDAVFSDNAFDLCAGETRRVWIARGESDLKVIQKERSVLSLWDTFGKTEGR